MSRNAVVLSGNGLSIAFNPELTLSAITDAVLERIRGLPEGSGTVEAMKAMATLLLPHGADSESDFEVLIGAFGDEDRALEQLHALANAIEPEDEVLAAAIETTRVFTEKVRRLGMSYVLQVIMERSYASRPAMKGLDKTTRAICTAFDGNVTFANLNYDTLLLASLLNLKLPGTRFTDAGWGNTKTKSKITYQCGQGEHKIARQLRATATDFPLDYRVRLLQLHGSMTYWRETESGNFIKLDREDIKPGGFWTAFREGNTSLEPAVVLASTNTKAAQICEPPFALAYEMTSEALRKSDHWVIVGYSFKDAPINAIIREMFAERQQPPKVMMATLGDFPTRSEVLSVFDWDEAVEEKAEWLTEVRSGADGLTSTDEWISFVA